MSLTRAVAPKSLAALAFATATVTAVALGTGPAAQASNAPAPAATTMYIVQMVGAPLASYSGTLTGYAATKPAAGHKLAAHSATATRYGGLLTARQNALLGKAGVSTRNVAYHYSTTFNGVAVRLTARQVATLQKTSGVLRIFKNRELTIQTPPTPKFLGLTGPSGVWAQQFGNDLSAGKGIIIGDIDTGFWPESPSFAAFRSPRSDDAVIAAKWSGICDPGADHTVTCNNKVIGARWYDSTGNADLNPAEFHSPRDFDGHGSHTASTAAGDHVSGVTINGVAAGDLEGVAPGARIAVYKALWESADGTTATGSSSDLVAAIDDAVSDGVDVINYSIGDNVDTFGPEELAFLGAADAGVFVSAAAGNAGPGAGTVDNAMPWETTVAAGTYDRSFTKSVTLGNGVTYTGVGVGAAVPSAPLVDSANVALAGHTVTDATLCVIGALDPAQVAGKIVLCQRGVNARTDKSKAVQQAGGVGMILWNPSANSLNADFHFVPTVHVDTASGTAIKAYIAGTGSPTASMSAGVAVTVEAPAVAAFSSRGPSPSSGGSLLKPDIMAPGNDVIAAVSPANHNGNLYDTESGTSMATPHIAGVAALIMSKHPTWPPMWVKSAIMTGAKQTDNAGNPIQGIAGDATPLEMGAGEVTPARDFDPGLVYDSTLVDWIGYGCGIGVHLFQSDGTDDCTLVPTIAPSDFNDAAIAMGSVAGTQTVTRTVTNVTGKKSQYVLHATAPAGFTIRFSPKVLVVAPNGTATYSVTLTRTTATFGEFTFGGLTMRDQRGHYLRSAIAARAVPLAAPVEADVTGSSGTSALSLKSGYAGSLTATASGLVAADVSTTALVTDTAGFSIGAPAAGPGTEEIDFTIPAGTKLARAQTFAGDYPDGTDVDLYVYSKDSGGHLTLAGISASGSATEVVDLTAPGDYVAFVDLFANPNGTTSPLDVSGYTFLVPAGNAGNFTATPASQAVSIGGAATVTLGWTGLTSGQHYLGLVEYGDGTNVIGQTTVAVNP